MSYYTDTGKYQKKLDKLVFDVEPQGDGGGLLGAALFIMNNWYNESIPAEETINSLSKEKYSLSKAGYAFLRDFFSQNDSGRNNSYEDLVSRVVQLLEQERKKTKQSLVLHNLPKKSPAKSKAKTKVSFKNEKPIAPTQNDVEFLIAEATEKREKRPVPLPKLKVKAKAKPKPRVKVSPKAKAKAKAKTKPCPKDKIINPQTGRCVKRDGKLGKQLTSPNI